MTDSDKLITMEELLESSPLLVVPEPGQLIDGTVITVYKNRILVDLDGVSTGLISGKETHDSHDTIKSIQPGDTVSAFVLESENDEGLTVLSLRKASQKKTWQRYVDAFDNQEVIKVRVIEANKGGLLLETDGIKGFIPVSQLAPMHYPRVNGADSAKILARLQKLVGVELECRIINIDNDTGKLVLSEKAAYREKRNKALDGVAVGTVVTGEISGVVNFGIFVAFSGLEGLVHISEIAWGHVKDPADYGKLGEPVEVKVIGIEGEKISLSMKQLSEDPWAKIASKYKEGDVVEGKINRLEDFGAFVEMEDEIDGLIHISDFTEDENEDISKYVQVGDKVRAKVIVVDTDNRRIGLSTMELTKLDGTVVKMEPKAKKEDKKEAKKEAKTEEKKEAKTEEKASGSVESLELGEKVTKSLIDAGFKMAEDIKKASDEEIQAVDGIGPAAVKKIREALS